MHEHLVFFDDQCPFCHKAVRNIIGIDKHHRFIFAPLQGETAKDVLLGPNKHYANANSLVLVENYQSTNREFYLRSKAVLRIYWLIGDGWGLFGIFSFLPSWPGDYLYRKIAEHRHQFKIKPTKDLGPKERFLP